METCTKRAILCRLRCFEQRERAAEIGANHRLRREDAAVDVRFGGEVHDGIRLFFANGCSTTIGVADVAVHKAVALIAIDRRQILQIPGVGQLVEIDDVEIGIRDHHAHKRRADETGATGYQNFHEKIDPSGRQMAAENYLCCVSQS